MRLLHQFDKKKTAKVTIPFCPQAYPIPTPSRGVTLPSTLPSFDVAATMSSSEESMLTWDIKLASMVTRGPVILPDLTPWEIENETLANFKDWHYNYHLPLDLYSDRPEERVTEMPPAFPDETFVIDDGSPHGVTLAPRVTEDDRCDNRKSLNRALQHHLYLIVQDKSSSTWDFPQGLRTTATDDRLRSMAVQSLKFNVGKQFKVWPLGNAPMGHISYLYDGKTHEKKQETQMGDGAKVFYYRSKYRAGDVVLNKEVVKDYNWVTKEELADYLDADYNSYIQHVVV